MNSEQLIPALLLALVVLALGLWWFLRDRRVRVLLVGEGPRCYALALEIARGSTCEHFKLVGWVLDAKRQAANRFQSYGHFPKDRAECLALAAELGVPVYDGSIHSKAFKRWYRFLWVGLVLMAGFGEKVSPEQIAGVKGWWLNTHPSPKWLSPSQWDWPNRYRGAQPYQKMLEDGVTSVAIVLHAIDEFWDEGTYLCQSEAREMWSDVPSPVTHAEVAGFLRNMHNNMSEPTVMLIRQLAPRIVRAIRAGKSPQQFAVELAAEWSAAS